MATKCAVRVQCLNCLMDFESEIYTNVDRVKDRRIISKIFKGKFNYISCVHCENQGLVCFPVEFTDCERGQKAILIYMGTNTVPVMSFDVIDSDNELGVGVCPMMFKGFRVTEIVRNRQPETVLYSDAELIFKLFEWGEGWNAPLERPSDERIQNAVEMGLISDDQAKILREVDFDGMVQRLLRHSFEEDSDPEMDVEDYEIFLTDEERIAVDAAIKVNNWFEKEALKRRRS